MKEEKLLDYNKGRNDKYITVDKEIGQDKYICLLPTRNEENIAQVEVLEETEVLEQNIQNEDYVTSEDAKKITAVPYMGGKNTPEMNRNISALLPLQITNMVEPFAGSAAITLNARNISGKICLNDKDPAMFNLWSVLADKEEASKLLETLKNTEYSKCDFDKALIINKNAVSYSNVERAWSEIILLYCSFDCLRSSYRTMTPEKCLSLKNRVLGNIRRTIKKLQKHEVIVTNKDALEVIKESTSEDTLYIDPPYDAEQLTSNNLYRYVYENKDQERFLQILVEKGNEKNPPKMLVSGYGNEDVNKDFYSNRLGDNWKRYKIGSFHKASSNKKGKSSRGTEYVWCNFTPHETALQFVTLEEKQKGGAEHE